MSTHSSPYSVSEEERGCELAPILPRCGGFQQENDGRFFSQFDDEWIPGVGPP